MSLKDGEFSGIVVDESTVHVIVFVEYQRREVSRGCTTSAKCLWRGDFRVSSHVTVLVLVRAEQHWIEHVAGGICRGDKQLQIKSVKVR